MKQETGTSCSRGTRPFIRNTHMLGLQSRRTYRQMRVEPTWILPSRSGNNKIKCSQTPEYEATVCSVNAISLACSGDPQIIICFNCKLAILFQQEFRARDVESQDHFHSLLHKVPPDYQVTKVTL